MNLYFPQIAQIFNTESTEFFHREHKDCVLCLSFRRDLKEFMIFRVKSLSLIAQITQIFLSKRLSITFVIPKEAKRIYDFDKRKSFSLIALIAQIFYQKD